MPETEVFDPKLVIFVLYWLPDMPYTNRKEKMNLQNWRRKAELCFMMAHGNGPWGCPNAWEAVKSLKLLSSGKDDAIIHQTHGFKGRRVYTFIN